MVIADYYGYQCSEAPFPLLMPPTPCRKRRTGFEDAEGVHVGGRKIRYSEPSSAVKGSETAPMTMPGGGVLTAVAALAAATRLVTAVTILILLRAVTIFSGRVAVTIFSVLVEKIPARSVRLGKTCFDNA